MNIQSYMKTNLGAMLLPLPTEGHVPGALLNRSNLMVEGDIRAELPDHTPPFAIANGAATLPTVNLSDKSKLVANATVLGLVDVSATVANEIAISYNVKDMAYRYMPEYGKIALNRLLLELRKSQPSLAREFLHHYLVVSTFYAREFTVTYKSSGQFLSEAEITAKTSLKAGVNSTFEGSGTVTYSGDANIPFAFAGWIPQF